MTTDRITIAVAFLLFTLIIYVICLKRTLADKKYKQKQRERDEAMWEKLAIESTNDIAKYLEEHKIPWRLHSTAWGDFLPDNLPCREFKTFGDFVKWERNKPPEEEYYWYVNVMGISSNGFKLRHSLIKKTPFTEETS